MRRASLIVAATLVPGGAALADLPGTLSYRNVTSQRITQLVPEATSNEKEVEFGDFDNDNDLDVVIANAYSDFGQRKNKMYVNNSGAFVEVSSSVPLFTTGSGDVARNAFFRDYTQDGWLDLIIVCDNNTAGDPGRTKLWVNVNDGVNHIEWSEEGLARLGASTGGAACGAISIDADEQNGFDLYVGNYPGPSQDTMYFNDGLGFFTNVTGTHVPTDSDYTVDVSSADMNGDGNLDILVTSGSDPSYIYYNDNQGAGSGTGDYRYTGSTQFLATPAFEAAMEPGDFDKDGDMDIYFSNIISTQDRILINTGNDAGNKATFSAFTNLPASVETVTSRKATVADLNNDGRDDVFVMKEAGASSRPTVLRNTSVNGQISFVDWTNADAFPSNDTHKGWHAAAFDTDGDGDRDIFLGGWEDDHLFLKVPSAEYDEADLGGVVPNVYNNRAAAVTGAAAIGAPDEFDVPGLASSAFLSVVLNGPDDYMIELLDPADVVLETVDRGGPGIEEAVQYDPASMPSTVTVRVSTLACANAFDITGDCGVGIQDFLDLLAAWGPNPGHPADYDGDDVVGILDFLTLLENWGEPVDYILELLARSG